MNPGRELDVLIAEKVMGWKRVGEGWHTKPHHKPSKDYPGTILNNWDSKGEHDFLAPPWSTGNYASERIAFCGCDGDVELPSYSTDIKAAWEVVEKLNRWHFELLRVSRWDGDLVLEDAPGPFPKITNITFPEGEDGFLYTVTLRGVLVEHTTIAESKISASHAICLAALLSKGINV